MRAPQSVRRRANSYAGAKIRSGAVSGIYHGALATGWRDGYRRAMAEVRKVLWKSPVPLVDLDRLTSAERMK